LSAFTLRTATAFATFTASGSQLLHFLAGLCALVFAQLSVLISVEFLQQLLLHFGALAISLFGFLVGWFGDCGGT
jgi:hypothetical protein